MSTDVRRRGPERVPPPILADEDAERAVLGALLLYGQARSVLRLVDRGLRPESFYWDFHGAIFAAVVSLAQRKEGIDAVTVNAEMRRLGTLTDATQRRVDELPSYVPAAGNVDHYAEIVVEQAQWRFRLRGARAMINAIEDQDPEAWGMIAAKLIPQPREEAVSVGPSVLRIVDEAGTVVEERVKPCDACRDFQDQLAGAQKEIQGWRSRYANLARDREREARADGMWQTAQRLFEHWKKLTNHKRSPFTAERFYQCVPYLRNPVYGPEMVERAIAGIHHDPFITTRLNGTKKKHDDWDLLFRSSSKFEEYANRAPLPWKSELQLPGSQKASLTVVEGGA